MTVIFGKGNTSTRMNPEQLFKNFLHTSRQSIGSYKGYFLQKGAVTAITDKLNKLIAEDHSNKTINEYKAIMSDLLLFICIYNSTDPASGFSYVNMCYIHIYKDTKDNLDFIINSVGSIDNNNIELNTRKLQQENCQLRDELVEIQKILNRTPRVNSS